jgi:hypothetical protein
MTNTAIPLDLPSPAAARRFHAPVIPNRPMMRTRERDRLDGINNHHLRFDLMDVFNDRIQIGLGDQQELFGQVGDLAAIFHTQ